MLSKDLRLFVEEQLDSLNFKSRKKRAVYQKSSAIKVLDTARYRRTHNLFLSAVKEEIGCYITLNLLNRNISYIFRIIYKAN